MEDNDLVAKKILLVDDEAPIRSMLADDFEIRGATVFEASDGVEALTILRSHKINMVISDIRMPKMDGIALLKQIREIDPHIPIVILVTGHSEVTADEASQLGADAYFTKPLDRQQLHGFISQRLNTG